MSLTHDRLGQALELLTAQGRIVSTNPGACVIGSEMYVPIDGELRSAAEIIHMNTLQDYSAACFTARGRAYEVRVYYDCGGQTYEVYQDADKHRRAAAERRRLARLRQARL